jgi:hypothetical protein
MLHRLNPKAGLAATLMVAVLPLASPVYAAEGLPAYAQPGQCFGKVTTPAIYKSEKRQELVSKGGSRTRTIPAVVQSTPHKTLVRHAGARQVRLPAVYRVVETEVTVPGARIIVETPARYREIEEKILVEPAHGEWRRSDAPLAFGEHVQGSQTMVHPTGEVYCRVWVPDRFGVARKRVLVSPGETHEEIGPATTRIERKKVLVTPSRVVTRTLPAVYRTTYTKKVIRPARTETVKSAAQYRTVDAKVIVRGEGQGWAQVFCGGQINPAFMAKVQAALAAKGYHPGPADGVARAETYSALSKFQADNQLARGQLTIETGRALGVY